MFDIVLVCRRLRQLPPMRVQNLHSKLGASQSFSRKITTRYLLKLIIPIIIYYHLTLRMIDSISPAGCPLITTPLALFFFIDI